MKKYGLEIKYEYTPTEKQKQMTSADYRCVVTTDNNPLGSKGQEITISLKTKSGSLTVFNSGTTLRSSLFKSYNFTQSEKELVSECAKKVKRIQSKNFRYNKLVNDFSFIEISCKIIRNFNK